MCLRLVFSRERGEMIRPLLSDEVWKKVAQSCPAKKACVVEQLPTIAVSEAVLWIERTGSP
jgi:hypothetical protein